MPPVLLDRLHALFPTLAAGSPSRELRGIYFRIHLAAGVLGGLIGAVWGGPAEWFTTAIWLLLLGGALLVVRGSTTATVLVHSMLNLLLLDVYLAQPDALTALWEAGPLTPAVAAALSCFWLGVYGGWSGGLAGVLLVLALHAETLPERVGALWLLGLLVALGQAHGALHRRLVAARRRMRREALTDPATGLFNLRALERELPRLRATAARQEQPLLMTVWDVDGLKTINDTWGHAAGDAVLASFTAALIDSARTSDSLYRVGGDEFVGLHPGLSEGALLIARLRQRFPLVSVGWVEDDGSELSQLREVADRRLYRDKADRRGRRQSRAGMEAIVRRATQG
jgi:GGDEF domain-containing protein